MPVMFGGEGGWGVRYIEERGKNQNEAVTAAGFRGRGGVRYIKEG